MYDAVSAVIHQKTLTFICFDDCVDFDGRFWSFSDLANGFFPLVELNIYFGV